MLPAFLAGLCGVGVRGGVALGAVKVHIGHAAIDPGLWGDATAATAGGYDAGAGSDYLKRAHSASTAAAVAMPASSKPSMAIFENACRK